MDIGETYSNFLKKLPGVTAPIKKLSFKDKMKWTAGILFIYYLMSQVFVFGIGETGFEYFQYLQIVLGSQFGTLITLGIGPIVTASIILQLLVGSKIIPWDLSSEKGKTMFQGTQKLLAIIFALGEAWIFVSFGAIRALPEMGLFVIIQLAIGGWVIIFMDEVISKWGFGSGVGIFIVAGVSKTIITRMFNPLGTTGSPAGHIPAAIVALGEGSAFGALLTLLPVIATFLVFFIVIYSNSIKVEVPLAFGSIRGFGRRWPLKFFYTSNMPVILIAALLANVQLMGRMLSRGGSSWLAVFNNENQIVGGVLSYLIPPQNSFLAGMMITAGVFGILGAVAAYFLKKNGLKFSLIFAVVGGAVWYLGMVTIGPSGLAVISLHDVGRMVVYTLFMVAGAVVFSIFWVKTAGMDAKSVSEQIESTGMQIPGYRRDVRIIERVLDRYIPHLAVLGGAAVGALAAFADFTFALGTGTGILLATMIVYQLYEEITTRHGDDMPPAVRKLLGQE